MCFSKMVKVWRVAILRLVIIPMYNHSQIIQTVEMMVDAHRPNIIALIHLNHVGLIDAEGI